MILDKWEAPASRNEVYEQWDFLKHPVRESRSESAERPADPLPQSPMRRHFIRKTDVGSASQKERPRAGIEQEATGFKSRLSGANDTDILVKERVIVAMLR